MLNYITYVGIQSKEETWVGGASGHCFANLRTYMKIRQTNCLKNKIKL